eukprot:Em0016g596a
MNRCQVCGSGVLEVKNRRRLESAKSKHCRDGIIALCRSIAVDLERDVCKKCFLEVGKYQALKRQYEYLEADLKSKLSRTLQPSLSEPLHRHHSSRHYPSNHRHHSNLRHHSSFVNYEGKWSIGFAKGLDDGILNFLLSYACIHVNQPKSRMIRKPSWFCKIIFQKGDSATTAGLVIPRIPMIFLLVSIVAVAVIAIKFT